MPAVRNRCRRKPRYRPCPQIPRRNSPNSALPWSRCKRAQASGAPVEVQTVRILSMSAGPERAALLDATRQKPDGLSGEEARLFNLRNNWTPPRSDWPNAGNRAALCAPRKAACVRSSWERDSPAHVAERYTVLQRANARLSAPDTARTRLLRCATGALYVGNRHRRTAHGAGHVP